MNVILIFTDDQGYGDCSCLNKLSKFKTPNIDSIATDGILFNDAHSSSAVCSPSRYGILTGRYDFRTRLKSGVMKADETPLVAPDRNTIASLFKRNGYSTLMVGKWHLGMTFAGEFGNRDWNKDIIGGPCDCGFDYFYGIPASMNFGLLTYIENKRVTEPANVFTAKKKTDDDFSNFHFLPPYELTKDFDTSDYAKGGKIEIASSFKDDETLGIFTNKAIEKINEQSKKDKPFFMYVALNSPHKPVCPAKQFWGKSGAGRYGDFMMETDYQIGRILDCIKENKIEDDTMVIFTSDNGPEDMFVPRKEKFGHDSAGGLRGGKRDLYEGGHRLPLFIKYPKMIKKGTVTSQPVCQTDLFATFAEMLGDTVKDTEAEDSVSMLSVLKNNSYPKDYRGAIVHHSCGGYFAIREGKWKLNTVVGGGAIKQPIPKYVSPEESFELFDLENDKEEKHNLIKEYPEIAQKLISELTQIIKNGRSTPGTNQKNDEVSWWEQLTWLPKNF